MNKLFLFELKKIFSRKIVWAGIILIVFLSVTNFSSMDFSFVNYEREIAAKYEGILDDSKVQKMLADFMPTKEQREQMGGINVAYIGMNSIQQAVHLHFANADGSWNGKSVEDVFGQEKIQVGFHSWWFDLSRNMVKIVIALAILTIIIVSPVFAGEYGGMDHIILSSYRGKNGCFTAKILVSFLVPLILTAVFLTGNLAAAIFLMGTDGLDSSVLFCGVYYEHYIPFHMSCLEMLLYQMGLAISGMIMLVAVIITISSLSGTQTVSLIISALFFLIPEFFSMPETNPAFRVVGLLPIYQFQYSSLMSVPQIGKNIPYAVAAFPAAVVVVIAGTALARKAWANHQVL